MEFDGDETWIADSETLTAGLLVNEEVVCALWRRDINKAMSVDEISTVAGLSAGVVMVGFSVQFN